MRVVVVGHGMAGSRFATELRSRAPKASIIVLGEERHAAYNRILLSSVVAGRVDEAAVTIESGAGIDVRSGVAVARVERAERCVVTAGGAAIEYDRLVLATGSRPVLPPIDGLSTVDDRVMAFRTLDDCRRIVALARTAGTAVVLGGGLLGIEAAHALAARGIRVTLLHGVGHLMERQLNPAASRVLEATLARLGIGSRLDVRVSAVRADPAGVTVLGEGLELRTDLLIVSCGVRAETELAARAGLAVGRGVLVDDGLRTSDPAILAIGDCAEHDGAVGGLVAPAWEQARVAAQGLAGEPARYRPIATVARLKAGGIDLAAMGELEPGPGVEEISFADPTRGTYARLLVDGDRLAGAILLGDNPTVATVIQHYDRATPVPADRRTLLLGRSFGEATAGPAEVPATMADAAEVCHCNAVTKGALVARWRAGARTGDALVAATRATTGCGTCRDTLSGIVAWLSTVDKDSIGQSTVDAKVVCA